MTAVLERINGEKSAMAIDLASCSERETLVATTGASVYELIVLRADVGEVLVRGGRHFTEFHQVLFLGSTAAGTSLRARTIDVGLRMKFICGDRLVTTSAVQRLSRRPASPSAPPVTAAVKAQLATLAQVTDISHTAA